MITCGNLAFNRFFDVELPVVFPPYKQLREVGVEFTIARLIGEQTCCILRVSLDVDEREMTTL